MNWNLVDQVGITLLAAVISWWLTRHHYLDQRRSAFKEQQLREFYSPILGLRKIIEAKIDVRFKVSHASDETWRQLCADARQLHNPVEASERLSKERFPSFQKAIDFDQDQFKSEILPMFRQMLVLFKEKYSLADADTQKFLPALAEFVDLWERNLAGALPWEVIETLKPTERDVVPFYAHIQLKHELLRKKSSGKSLNEDGDHSL